MGKKIINDLKLRRCTVYGILKDIGCDSSSLIKPMWILEREFTSEDWFPILEFIEKIESFTDLLKIKSQLITSLTKTLYLESCPYHYDPWEDMQLFQPQVAPGDRISKQPEKPSQPVVTSYDSRQPAPRAKGPPGTVDSKTVVFNTLLIELEKHIVKYLNGSAANMRNDLQNNLASLKLRDSACKEMLMWCSGRVISIANPLEIADMKNLIHYIYLWSCHHIGPVDTDNLFTASFKNIEELPETSDFPPRQLL